MVLVDFNSILDALQGCVGSFNEKENLLLNDLLKRFQLTDCYRPYHLRMPVWTWSNGNGSFRSYLGRILVRARDKSSFNCPVFVLVSYTDHKLVT